MDDATTPKERPALESGSRRRAKKGIGEMLIEEGFVESEHVLEALEIQKKTGSKIVQILIDQGHIDIRSFARFLAKQPGVPSIDLSKYDISRDICSLVPKDFALTHEVFPIDQMGRVLTVGMTCPLDSTTIRRLEAHTGLTVNALLCDPGDIRAAINENYGARKSRAKPAPKPSPDRIETSMKLENAARLVSKIDALPTLPRTVQKVQQAMDNPHVSMREVAQTVSQDPPISAKLLQLANSSVYGLSHLVDNVGTAATLLGLKETYLIVLSSAVIDVLDKSEHFNYEQFWRQSTFCALAARHIFDRLEEKPRPGVFTAGLLHDIGRFALVEAAPTRYQALDTTLAGMALVQEEQRVLGLAHPEAGYILARHWHLPEEITEAIRFHHTPHHAQKAKWVVAVVALAAHIAHLHDQEESPQLHDFAEVEYALNALKLKPQDGLAVLEEADGTYEQEAADST